jgi:hypothetical protein
VGNAVGYSYLGFTKRIPIMANSWKARCWLGVVGLAWLFPQPAQAWGICDMPPPREWIPGLVICNKTCYLPPYMQNLAPWYTYFPADETVMGAPPGATYPTWQSNPLPPQSRPAQTMGYPAYPQGLPSQGLPEGQTVGNWQPPIYQPVGYPGASVPSYWFAR